MQNRAGWDNLLFFLMPSQQLGSRAISASNCCISCSTQSAFSPFMLFGVSLPLVRFLFRMAWLLHHVVLSNMPLARGQRFSRKWQPKSGIGCHGHCSVHSEWSASKNKAILFLGEELNLFIEIKSL